VLLNDDVTDDVTGKFLVRSSDDVCIGCPQVLFVLDNLVDNSEFENWSSGHLKS
jgi:hypothetical protein